MWKQSNPSLTSPFLVSNSMPICAGSKDGTEMGYVSIVGIVQVLYAISAQYDQHTLLEPSLTIRERREHRSKNLLVTGQYNCWEWRLTMLRPRTIDAQKQTLFKVFLPRTHLVRWSITMGS